MQLIFYRAPGGLFDKLVRLVTFSKYSHCELVIEGISWSSSIVDKGIRRNRINVHSGHWDIIEISDDYKADALEWFLAHEGRTYDHLGALRFLIPCIPNAKDKWFCSEACAEALGLANPAQYTPKTLYQLWESK